MLTRSNAREHHFFVERAQCRTVNAAHDIRATCSWQTGPTAHVESVGVIAKVRCQQLSGFIFIIDLRRSLNASS